MKIEKIVNYYSSNDIEFKKFPRYSAKIHQLASLKVLEDFKPISKNQFKISKLNCSGHNNFKIDISKKSCTCPFWLKHAICSHSLAFSNLKELSWFGPAYSGKSKIFFY